MDKYNIRVTGLSDEVKAGVVYMYYTYNNRRHKQPLYVKTLRQAERKRDLLIKCLTEGIYPYAQISSEWSEIMKDIK